MVERYNRGYTADVKTAISIPDEIFEAAERFAREQGMSRSELYAVAVRRYLSERSGERITEQLDEIYADEESGLDPVLARLQELSLPKESW